MCCSMKILRLVLCRGCVSRLGRFAPFALKTSAHQVAAKIVQQGDGVQNKRRTLPLGTVR